MHFSNYLGWLNFLLCLPASVDKNLQFMSPGGRYESWQQNQHETKRRKLDEGEFPPSKDVSLERMLFNQLLALTEWLFLKKVLVLSELWLNSLDRWTRIQMDLVIWVHLEHNIHPGISAECHRNDNSPDTVRI